MLYLSPGDKYWWMEGTYYQCQLLFCIPDEGDHYVTVSILVCLFCFVFLYLISNSSFFKGPSELARRGLGPHVQLSAGS